MKTHSFWSLTLVLLLSACETRQGTATFELPTNTPADLQASATTPTLSPAPVVSAHPPTHGPLTLTPTPIAPLSQTLTVNERVRQLAEAGVKHNSDWVPYIVEIGGVQIALVPAGCFQMGGNVDDAEPVHEVCFNKPFWIDVYEVTEGQYDGVEWGCEKYPSSDNHPQVCVNWNEALIQCQAHGARLPTEAEWEYTARGPDGLIYPWGNEFVADNAVYSGNYYSVTREVGSKPGGVSWVGTSDLSGSVWEWAADWYGIYPSEQQVDPIGPDTGQSRVLRGGSWDDDPDYLRADYRRGYSPGSMTISLGFRCAYSD